MLACSFQQAGLQVFDIRDPYHPEEIECWKPAALRTAFLPGSFTCHQVPIGPPTVTAGKPRFVKVGDEVNLWSVSDGNGFQAALHAEFQSALLRRL
jgi:hypothetical protein